MSRWRDCPACASAQFLALDPRGAWRWVCGSCGRWDGAGEPEPMAAPVASEAPRRLRPHRSRHNRLEDWGVRARQGVEREGGRELLPEPLAGGRPP